MDMGELIPCGIMEVLPGDSIQQSTNALVRASPLLAPVMHPTNVRIHHWFVPFRLIWEDWEDFITGGPDGMDDSIFPTIESPVTTGFGIGSLGDYLGVPATVPELEVSALPFRAYQLIYNEWYRDQDLTAEGAISKESGPDTTTAVNARNISWEKDYFTSSRPWEQKGPTITIPLGDSAPIQGIAVEGGDNIIAETGAWPVEGGQWTGIPAARANSANDNIYVQMENAGVPPSGTNRPQVFADLTSASAITVTALREALALQRYQEARARYGSRYTEYLQYLGVRSSDARLQRPEYLGGGSQTVQFSEILQTAEGSNPVGTLRGHGINAMRSNRYRRFFEEHGYVMSLISIRPKTIYADGLARHWNRRTKEDFWQKELQHIGQQEVLMKEIYAAATSPGATFGFQDRYDEYRRTESTIAGEFRTELNFWHMARLFASEPALNALFVKCEPTERTFAVPSRDVFYVMARHNIQARRLVSNSAASFIY